MSKFMQYLKEANNSQDQLFAEVVADWAENEGHILWVTNRAEIAKVKKLCKEDPEWATANTVSKMEDLIGKYTPEE